MRSFFKKKKKSEVKELKAFLNGEVIPISSVPDQVFSAKVLGDGIAIEPSDGRLVAPGDGEIIALMTDTKHACGLRFENGVEALIHVGLDTVDMKGEGFELFVKMGDQVKCGDPLISFDLEKIKAAGHPAVTIFAVTDEGSVKSIHYRTGMKAQAGVTTIVDFL